MEKFNFSIFEHSAFFGQKSCTKTRRVLNLGKGYTESPFTRRLNRLHQAIHLQWNVQRCTMIHIKEAQGHLTFVLSAQCNQQGRRRTARCGVLPFQGDPLRACSHKGSHECGKSGPWARLPLLIAHGHTEMCKGAPATAQISSPLHWNALQNTLQGIFSK